MAARDRVLLVVLWIVSVILAGAYASAQSRQVRPEAAPVISGADIGFRPDGWQGKARTGTFVVRINGEWVEAIPGATVRPAITR
jgi:3',5'-cyclic AMP phosphodiesterase CpdA